MKVITAGKTDKGLKRKLNEDSLLLNDELGLYVIADGMGGHKAGEVASRMVVETMADYWDKVKNDNPPSFFEPITNDVSENARHLINSISLSNIIVHEAQKRPEYHRMGTTVSALLIERNCMWAGNVGDSPVFLFDQGRLILVSEEHSVEAEKQKLGRGDSLSSTSPFLKNILTRVLGLNEKVNVYITPIRPEKGDIIMMCSDGLTNFVSVPSIKSILSEPSLSLEEKADLLIDGAKEGGGGDNISVILVEVVQEGTWQKIKKRFLSKR
jgi:serine/threonine protein phosphatase PrpC